MRTAIVSSSRNGRTVLDAARLALLFDERIDGEIAAQLGLASEVAAAGAIDRLLAERLGVRHIVHLTGLDRATVRRLRQHATDYEPGP